MTGNPESRTGLPRVPTVDDEPAPTDRGRTATAPAVRMTRYANGPVVDGR
ncbi:hypothetical protein [Streptomyces sp. NPDC005423]